MKYRQLLLGITAVMSFPLSIQAQTMDQMEPLERAKEEQIAREARLGEERIHLQDDAMHTIVSSSTSLDGHTIPAEQPVQVRPSFFVSHIRIVKEPIHEETVISSDSITASTMETTTFLDNSVPASTRMIKGPLFYEAQRTSLVLDVPKEFLFLSKTARPFVNQKMTVEDINTLAERLNMALVSHGYITSRIGIPAQSLASGQLQFNLQVGRIESVVYKEKSPHLPWENAFPLRPGDILNIRDIEQGLEQMKRIGSQDVAIELEPGMRPLSSRIVLQTTKRPPIHGVISVDDSGMKDTGKLQWNAAISIDRLFNANDVLRISANHDGANEGYVKGTKNHSISYSIPRGKDTFSIGYSNLSYHQSIQSIVGPVISSSRVKSVRGTWQHVFHRDRTTKRSWDISISKRNSHNYINDVDIAVQRADTATVEVGVSERRYIKQNTVYSRIGVKQGVGWFGSQPDFGGGAPSTRFTQILADVDYQIPRWWGHRPASITTSFHGQWTLGGKRLFSRDMMSIGNRYTVQGFDGERTLLGESGWYVRNEVASYIPRIHSSVYVNLDFGAVYGPSTDILTGRFIAGTALGIRGQFKSGLFYDAFIGVPLYKPSGYVTDHVTTGFQVGIRF